MTTILREIKISGISLMDGKVSTVRISPSVKKGIYFHPDNSDISIKACLDNVISTDNSTMLGFQDKQVRLVEHFMAACAFCGIDSLNVYLNSSELPIFDGSALKWVDLFKTAGIEETIIQKSIEFNEPVYLVSPKTSIVLLPHENLKISYCLDFAHPDLERKWYSWNLSENNMEIIEARTFGYLKDLEKFQKAGFALGANIDNTVGLTDTGYTVELRSKDEPIKHKILDLIGDLNLLEINPLRLKAHIIAQEAGHKTHIMFAKKVLQNRSVFC